MLYPIKYPEKELKIVKEKINSDQENLRLADAYQTLGGVVEAEPKLATEVLEVCAEALKSNKNDDSSLSCLCDTLGKVVEGQPALAPKVLDMVKDALQSDKKGGNALYEAYIVLAQIVNTESELAPEVFKTLKEALKSNKNDGTTIDRAYRTLGEIVKAKPVFDAFETFKQCLKSDKADAWRINNAYGVLSEVAEAKPALRKWVLETFKEGLKSTKNCDYSLKGAYDALKRLLDVKPKFEYDLKGSIVEAQKGNEFEVLETFRQASKSDENNGLSLEHAYETLDKIMKEKSEFTSKVFEIISESLKSDKNDYTSEWRGKEILGDINRDDPLQFKMDVLRQRLGRKVGKTADVETGEIFDKHAKTAEMQVKISKAFIKTKREQEGK